MCVVQWLYLAIPVVFMMMNGMVHLMGKNGTMANVTQADVMQSNGIIHVIDGVLLPSM